MAILWGKPVAALRVVTGSGLSGPRRLWKVEYAEGPFPGEGTVTRTEVGKEKRQDKRKR